MIIQKFFEMLAERPSYHQIESMMHKARTTYNQILFIKNKKSAYYLMNLAISDNKNRISELLKDDEIFRTHALNYHSVYSKKYFRAIDYYFYENEHGNNVWREPEIGDYLKFRSNYKDKNLAGKRCKLIKSVHHKSEAENLMQCTVEFGGKIIVCEFGDVRQINKR